MNMKKIVTLLFFLSLGIYGLQILIFRDPRNTGFYILQDMAFLPFTIAIATLIVGELLSEKERKDRMEKTKMLTSSFFTELGAPLLTELNQILTLSEEERAAIFDITIENEESVKKIQTTIRQLDLSLSLDEDHFASIRDLILEKQTMLLVIASNPLLLEHEEFTQTLWSIFHLVDEFRLRGSYAEMSQSDIAHLESDLVNLIRLLFISWASNLLYMKNNYPNFFVASVGRLRDQGGCR